MQCTTPAANGKFSLASVPAWVLDAAQSRRGETWQDHHKRVRTAIESHAELHRKKAYFKRTPVVSFRTSDAAFLFLQLWILPFADERPIPGSIRFLAHLINASCERAQHAVDELLALGVTEVLAPARGTIPRLLRMRSSEELATFVPSLSPPPRPSPTTEEEPPLVISEPCTTPPFVIGEPCTPLTTVNERSGAERTSSCKPPTSTTSPKHSSFAPSSESDERKEEGGTELNEQDLVVQAGMLIPGLHPKVVTNAISATGLENVRLQIEWFPHRSMVELGRFRDGPCAAFKSFCLSRMPEPLVLRQQREEDSRRAREEVERRARMVDEKRAASYDDYQRQRFEEILSETPPEVVKQHIATLKAETPFIRQMADDSKSVMGLLMKRFFANRDDVMTREAWEEVC